ncbi:hypothetical protein F53441_11906 [Fusarium austroafricanum]|uniref:Uncharacterized protein n=1 Tax=Fusarium austroafricanum TaxID=2364996 RepID=A0A8H4K1D2_9HYPO|nr:hypothetical protein F53441_11906 [Fusarium austroafricanum]
MENGSRGIGSWSRQLADATWEDASCDFHNNGFQAFGYVIYSSDEEEYTDDNLASRSIAFELTPSVLETAQSPFSILAAWSSNGTSETNGVESLKGRRTVSFSLVYDPSTYDKDQKTESRPTVRCGNLLLPTEGNRYVYAKLALKEYEQVQTKLYETARAENPQIFKPLDSQLYKHTLLIEASDEFPLWKEANLSGYLDLEPPLKNLHYTNLGFDAEFVISQIFKTIEVQKSLPDASGLMSFSGLARSYASMAEGNEGDAHVIFGTYMSVCSAHQSPHPLAKVMAVADVPTDREDCIAALGYLALDLSAVNASAQTTMANIMQCHMRGDDRKLFFGSVDRPVGLPAELTTTMQSTPEAAWIRDTYARAYICHVMNQQEERLRDEYKFTAQEKKKSGTSGTAKGRTASLSRPSTTNWSALFLDSRYASGTSGDFQIGSLLVVNPVTGITLLSKICTIMDALDDGAKIERQISEEVNKEATMSDTNSNHLVVAAIADQKGSIWLALSLTLGPAMLPSRPWAHLQSQQRPSSLQFPWSLLCMFPEFNTLFALSQFANIVNLSLSIAVLVAWFIIKMKNPPPQAPSALEIWMQDHGKP